VAPLPAQGPRQTPRPHRVGAGTRRPRAGVRIDGGRRTPYHVARHRRTMARSQGRGRHRRVRATPAPRYSPGAAPRELTGVVLDSDVIIEILRGHSGVLKTALDLDEPGVSTVCTLLSWAQLFAARRA